jgi:head-tail adaptor
MRAGSLRHRLKLWEKTPSQNASGGYDETWVELPGLWGEINTPSGRVEAVAQRLEAVVTAEVVARPRSSLLAGRRLSHAGITYLIEAVLPDNKRTLVRILCSSVPNS